MPIGSRTAEWARASRAPAGVAGVENLRVRHPDAAALRRAVRRALMAGAFTMAKAHHYREAARGLQPTDGY
jgi:hypothetical protein